MPDIDVIWDLDDDPDGNVRHIAEHGISVEEVEEVLDDPEASDAVSHSTGRSVTFGETTVGRYLAVVWETVLDEPRTIYVVTAYDAPRPRRKGRR